MKNTNNVEQLANNNKEIMLAELEFILSLAGTNLKEVSSRSVQINQKDNDKIVRASLLPRIKDPSKNEIAAIKLASELGIISEELLKELIITPKQEAQEEIENIGAVVSKQTKLNLPPLQWGK